MRMFRTFFMCDVGVHRSGVLGSGQIQICIGSRDTRSGGIRIWTGSRKFGSGQILSTWVSLLRATLLIP